MSSDRQRFLVCHDYGMGALYWWVWAESAHQVVTTYKDVEVLVEPAQLQWAEGQKNQEIDIETDTDPPGLERRSRAEKEHPDFGKLLTHSPVYLRLEDEGEWMLTEHGPDGRRLRQVTLNEDGAAWRMSADDWLFNPPFDLWDPELAQHEISRDEFERAWADAIPYPDED